MKKNWVAVPAMVGALTVGGAGALANDAPVSEAPADSASKAVTETAYHVISSEEAQSIAIEAAGGGEVTGVELEENVYDIDVVGEIEVDIDAYSGEVLEVESDDDEDEAEGNGDVIPEEEAVSIALGYVGVLAEPSKVELNEDDGQQVYEIELSAGESVYEFELDALTGELLSFEKDDA